MMTTKYYLLLGFAAPLLFYSLFIDEEFVPYFRRASARLHDDGEKILSEMFEGGPKPLNPFPPEPTMPPAPIPWVFVRTSFAGRRTKEVCSFLWR